MSNPKYTTEQKVDHRRRLANIEEKGLPVLYATTVSKKLGVTKDIVNNVRNGKTVNFAVLEALERLCGIVVKSKSKKQTA